MTKRILTTKLQFSYKSNPHEVISTLFRKDCNLQNYYDSYLFSRLVSFPVHNSKPCSSKFINKKAFKRPRSRRKMCPLQELLKHSSDSRKLKKTQRVSSNWNENPNERRNSTNAEKYLYLEIRGGHTVVRWLRVYYKFRI